MKDNEGDAASTVAPKRYVILDALRGLAILGICLANYPEFSLYSFLTAEAADTMPSAGADSMTRWGLTVFIDGKFYTIFSLLFGIGFSIILENVSGRGGNGLKIFYRRMFGLIVIGFFHLMFLWSGDILILYAVVGMTLPLFIRAKDNFILWSALFFLILPVILDTIFELARINPSAALVGWQWEQCDKYGITEENFAYWLRDGESYGDVFKFLIQGAIVRLQEFVDGNRYFKVLGLFLIGYYIGRNHLYKDLERNVAHLKTICKSGLLLGLPLSIIYAWSSISGHPLGNGFHSLLYFISVYLTGFGYIAGICLLYINNKRWRIWRALSAPGRMALTNYIGQSVIGMLIFYGIGFGLGASVGLCGVEAIALSVYVSEMIFSVIWLKLFRFGPLEWCWRCFTYGKIFQITYKK